MFDMSQRAATIEWRILDDAIELTVRPFEEISAHDLKTTRLQYLAVECADLDALGSVLPA